MLTHYVLPSGKKKTKNTNEEKHTVSRETWEVFPQ